MVLVRGNPNDGVSRGAGRNIPIIWLFHLTGHLIGGCMREVRVIV